MEVSRKVVESGVDVKMDAEYCITMPNMYARGILFGKYLMENNWFLWLDSFCRFHDPGTWRYLRCR